MGRQVAILLRWLGLRIGDDTGGYWCVMCQSQIKWFNREKNPAWQEARAKARETMRQKREENAG